MDTDRKRGKGGLNMLLLGGIDADKAHTDVLAGRHFLLDPLFFHTFGMGLALMFVAPNVMAMVVMLMLMSITNVGVARQLAFGRKELHHVHLLEEENIKTSSLLRSAYDSPQYTFPLPLSSYLFLF